MSARCSFRCLLFIAALGAVFCRERVAAGQPVDAQTRAAAQALFEEGVRLFDKKRYADACPKLAEAVRLYPGIGAKVQLANCYERAGMLASAWTMYDAAADAAERAHDIARARDARKKADALVSRRAFLFISVPESVQQAEGLEVRWDAVVITRAQWGTPIPVDPGNHRIYARATGKRPWQTDVRVEGEGSRETVVVGPLLDEIHAAPPPPPPPPVKNGGQRIAGFVLGGLGGAGLTVGIVTGSLAIARRNEAKPLCPQQCSEEGRKIRDEGRAFGNASTATFIGGAALLVVGAVLVLTAPRGSARMALRARGTTLEASGRW